MKRVHLTRHERETLEVLVGRSGDGYQVRRAQALLWLDDGEKKGAVAARLRVTRQTVWNWTRRWEQRNGTSLEVRLKDRPKSGCPGTKRRRVGEMLPKLLSACPRDLGYRPMAWTVLLLRHHIQEVEKIVVSYATVRRALRGLGYRYKRPRYVLARRSPTWRQEKGGSSAVLGSESAR